MPTLKNNIDSHRISVQNRNLISLPKDIREKLKINVGDVLDIRIEGNKIVLEPFKLVPSSQAYFWTEKAQSDMLEAKNDVENDRVREFTDINEFLKGLEND